VVRQPFASGTDGSTLCSSFPCNPQPHREVVSALQLKWLLFDLKTDRLLEEGRVTARRLPVGIVESLREKSRLEDFVNFLGTSDYGLPLEPFRKKYPDTALKLVFVVEQAQLLGGETWSREIVPTFAGEPEGGVSHPKYSLCDTHGKPSFCEDWWAIFP